MSEIGKKISKNIKKLPYPVKLWCEPGRYLVGEAGVMVTTIIGKTTRHNNPWVFVDAGRFQAFVEMFESNSLQYPIFTSIDDIPSSKPKSLYTVTGPSCDSYDTISRDISLPTNLQVGDRVYFATAGAYTHVYGAPFNDFPVPKLKFIN
jgi:ornithine decarboxylase